MAQFKQLVFSGVQPTGNLHLGNYLGAIKRFVALQDDATTASIASSTCTRSPCWQDPERADAARSARSTAAFLAAGIDPKKHIVFNQSQVPQHAELAWVFNCVARIGWLNRMTQFKEKAGKDRENASVGLYAYPILMAADILRLPRHPRAGRRGPEAAPGADPRHRPEVQQRLRRIDRGEHGSATPSSRCTEPLIEGPATRVMSPARRHEEDVEVGPVGLLAHQPDRRRRHDRPEDPQGEDRPGAAAGRGGGPRRPAGGREPRRHLRGAGGRDEGRRAARVRRRAVLGLQAGAGRPRGRRSSRRSPPRCGACMADPAISTPSSPTAPSGRRAIAARDHGRGQGHRRASSARCLTPLREPRPSGQHHSCGRRARR